MNVIVLTLRRVRLNCRSHFLHFDVELSGVQILPLLSLLNKRELFCSVVFALSCSSDTCNLLTLNWMPSSSSVICASAHCFRKRSNSLRIRSKPFRSSCNCLICVCSAAVNSFAFCSLSCKSQRHSRSTRRSVSHREARSSHATTCNDNASDVSWSSVNAANSFAYLIYRWKWTRQNNNKICNFL